jgi:flagellin
VAKPDARRFGIELKAAIWTDSIQTGASNLTLADTNEEAANSQALSTRQSIAVSALALANQSQQSVLQLLR